MALQTRLNELGYRDGAPDGRFGPVTDAAVRRFQADNGLTVDGFAGPVTHAALELPFWEKIDVSQITAEASSTNPPSGAVTYDVGNLLDDDDETSWQSTGADIEGGVPVTVTFTFAAPVEIDRLSIANGYEVLDRDTFFTKNARVRELKLVSGAQELTIELADDKEPQLVDIAFGAIDTLTLEVVSVYPGDEFPEVALTEVVFLTNSGA